MCRVVRVGPRLYWADCLDVVGLLELLDRLEPDGYELLLPNGWRIVSDG